MDEEQERRLAGALDRDLSALWEYAQEGLIIGLLRKAYPNPATQLRILKSHQTYINAGLRRSYTWWRLENPDADVSDFLAQAPGFTLPSLQGRSKRAEASLPLLKAFHDYNTVLALLKFKNRVKGVRRYRKLADRKQAIKEIVQGALGLQALQGKREKELEEKLQELQRLPREDIALEVAAWANGLETSYLERHKGKSIEKYWSAMLERRHTAAARLKSGGGTPAEREIYQRQIRLQSRLRRSKN